MMPAPYSAELRWRIIWFVILSRGQLAVRKAVSVGSLNKHDVDGSENVIWKCHFSRFCNHLSIIQSHYAWKMRFNYPGIKLKPALGTRQNWTFLIICWRRPHNCKKGHSRHRKNENVFKMSKDEKCTCKACKNTVYHCQICKFVGFVLTSSSWLLSATRRTHCFCILNMETIRSTTAIRRSLRQRFLK